MLVCLADAFATYAMGPAYACSAILLRFNPLKAYKDTDRYPAEAKRAHMILTTLKTMRAQDKDFEPPYGKTADRLEAVWLAALARAKPAGQLNAKGLQELDDWSKYVLEQLDKSHAKGLYQGRLLQNTQRALKSLFNEEDPAEILTGEEEGRDVLNAAWECRIEGLYDLRTIERKAQKLWDLITEMKRESKGAKSETYPQPPIIQGEKTWRKVTQ